jgi:mono/diheme cytochrome c family protein
VLVYKLGGTAKLDDYLVLETDRIPPTDDFGSVQQVELGRVLYDRNCMVCHGPQVVSSGVVLDLRWAQSPATQESFADVVLGGKYASAGMAAFEGKLTPPEVESIRAFIVSRAHEDAKPTAAGGSQ